MESLASVFRNVVFDPKTTYKNNLTLTRQIMASNRYTDTDPQCEPSIDDLLAEPIVQLFMARDGVSPTDIRGEFSRMQRDYWAQVAV